MSVLDRDKVLKLLVELLASQSREVVITTLRLTRLLMLMYEWRVSFATEGGVKAILSCMQEFSAVTQVQQVALAVSTGPTAWDFQDMMFLDWIKLCFWQISLY